MTRRNSKGDALPAAEFDGGSYDDHQIAEKEKTVTHVDSLPSPLDQQATRGQAPAVPHSPLPWHLGDVGHRDDIYSRGGYVARCLVLGSPQAAVNAAFIVRACNVHEDLVAALEDCSFQLATLAAATGQFREVYARSIDRATAVIAKARG